jgi:MFS family permease
VNGPGPSRTSPPRDRVVAGAPALPPSAAACAGALAPLRWPIFRALWIAALASNVGTWVHEVGAAWLMATLTASPTLIALVQAAATLPIFLLALLGGALADVVDRRRLLLVTQGWMMVTSAALGFLTNAGLTNAGVLLAGTFALGLGTALNGPAWQAIVPELVPREQMAAALTLNGVGINMARAAGPALGGFVVGTLGPGSAFLLNAVSFLGVMLVLFGWDRPPRRSLLPGETLLGAVQAGLRYARYAPDLRAVLVRSGVFIVGGSALWALLPVLVRYDLGLGPSEYGLLLGALGAGAVGGAFLLPSLRRLLSTGGQVTVAGLLMGGVLLLLAVLPGPGGIALALAGGGAAWIAILTAFHTGAQASLAPWVRGRGMAVYLLVFFGGLAGGSALWGGVAEHLGTRPAFACAAVAVIAGILATSRLPLPAGTAPIIAASRHWPAAAIAAEADAERGPVLVTVEYRIDPADAEAFARAMSAVRIIRMRDAAIRWDLLTDPADPGRYIESFLVESWIEHLRQHERITAADRDIEQRARRFHAGPTPPLVSHFIAKDLPG